MRDFVCYHVSGKYDRTLPADGAIFEMNENGGEISIALTDMTSEEIRAVHEGELKLDALRHQGKESEFDESAEAVGKKDSKSGRQIRRYVRLTELIYPLLDKVDLKIIPVTAGAEVSFLNVKLQVTLNDQIEFYECRLSMRQAAALKKHYLDGTLDGSVIREILLDYDDTTAISLNYKKLRAYFPQDYTAKQCETALWEILDQWHQKQCA